MRLFLAIQVPKTDQTRLQGLHATITGGRPVPMDSFHITLAFLGDDVGHSEAEDLHEQLESARLPAATLHLEGFGHFGHDTPRALWVGIGPPRALDPLHARVTGIARRAGLVLPRRRFVPHVTLARYSKGDPAGLTDLTRLFERHAPFSGAPFHAETLCLMRSHLTDHGPQYDVLADYTLT